MNVHRLLISGTGRTFIQETPNSDVHTQYGMIKAKTISAAKDGECIQTENGEQLIVISPSFIDKYKRIRRDAQIITFKDAGVIMATAGLGPESIVAEAGSGSGALTTLLARHCKQVYSYDISKHNLSVAQENINDFGYENVTFTEHDIKKGLLHGPVDCLILDMPEPWHTIKHREQLKIGAYIVTYLPSTVQLQQIRAEAINQGLQHIRTVEVTERHWQVRGDAVRPTSRNTAFTAFLCFFRYLGENWGELRPANKQQAPPPQLPSSELMEELFTD